MAGGTWSRTTWFGWGSMMLLALGWLTTTSLAFVMAQRRRFAEHRR